MQGAAPQPGHVGVERVADERVPEGGGAGVGLDDEPAGQQLLERPLARQPGDGAGVEARAGDRRHVGTRARRLGQGGRAEQHGVAHGLGDRHLVVARELQSAARGLQAVALAQGGAQLLDEEGHALGAVVHRARERRGQRLAQDALGQRRGLRSRQAIERHLVQRALAAQVVPQPPQRVAARDFVRAVGGDHEHGQRPQRARQAGQHVQRRLVGAVEVVEQHDERGPVDGGPQRAAHGLHERARVGRRRRLDKLGEHERQLRLQGPARGDALGPVAQVRPQRARERSVRGRGAVGRGATQHRAAGVGGHILGQACLADSRLTGEQYQPSAALPGSVRGLLEPAPLVLASDQAHAPIIADDE